MQHAAAGRHRQHRQGIGHGLGGQGGAFQRIKRDVDGRAFARTDLLADVEHGRFVALALTDDDLAVDIEAVQRRAHGVDGQLIGVLLVTAPDLGPGGDRGQLGDHGGVGSERRGEGGRVSHVNYS